MQVELMECVTCAIVAIVQIILSILLIIRRKNDIAILSEIFTSLLLFFVLNGFSIKIGTVFWTHITLTLIEYFSVKTFLVIFMLLARYLSFYIIRYFCQNKKKSKKLKMVKLFNNVKYWPKVKLGYPGKANRTHPKTKVRFDSRGFPKFKSYYTMRLRRRDFHETREKHFYIANRTLYEDKSYKSKIKAKLSRKQIKQLSRGETPDGYVWHHHQDAGVLQLVEEQVHAKTSHIGGYSIWGCK